MTIVRELLLQLGRGEIAGVPSAHVIRLSGGGTISVEGPVGAGGPSVARAAQLLDSLLPPAAAGSQFRVPGGLRLVVARGLGTLDLPPFESLESFTDALARFGSTDPVATMNNLVTAWAEYVGTRAPQVAEEEISPVAAAGQIESFMGPRGFGSRSVSELTVSDIRRARRATGLTLAQVARQSGVPLTLLRQLEWGYLLNWPSGRRGRDMLARYASAAGLDKDVVLTTIDPLLHEARSKPPVLVRRALPVYPAAEDATPVVDVEVTVVPAPAVETPSSSRWSSALAALAIPALLVIALLPAWWAISSRQAGTVVPEQATSERTDSTRPSAPGGSAPRSPAVDAPRPAGQETPTEPTARSAPDPAPPATGSDSSSTIPIASATPDQPYRPVADGFGDASLSPVGTAMFYADPDASRSGVMPASANSREAVLRITSIVDDGAKNLHLRVAPDGQRIAFDSDREGVRGVYVANSDGTNVRRVSPAGFAAFPSWSPDGRTLAFVRADPARPDVWNVWTLDLQDGELRQVSTHDSGQPSGASWFPDGRRIAYGRADRLIIRDVRTGRERVFASPRRNRAVQGVAVSPDGRRVIFHVARDGAWLLELADGSIRRVLEDATAQEYTWSPDGRRVAYHSRTAGGWGVWVMASR